MKTLLDLIQEFAVLNDAKTLGGGILSPPEEQRWRELRDFYDILMVQEGSREQPVARFSADEIRQHVSSRIRLRVRTDMEVSVQHETGSLSCRVGNLSCGGALLLCNSSLDVGSRVTLRLNHIERREGVLWVQGDVVWQRSGSPDSDPRYQMGIRFVGLEKNDWTKLDSFVVENIEHRILSLRENALQPEFVQREQLSWGQ